MLDFPSCFSEHAIKISDATCSAAPSSSAPGPHNTISCFYESTLSTKKQLLIMITWCKNATGQSFSVVVDDDPSCPCKVKAPPWQFWKKRGSRSVETNDKTKVEVYWDLSNAKYADMGSEPIHDFFLVVFADAEVALLLGTMTEEKAVPNLNATTIVADFLLKGRKERVTCKASYSTKVQFRKNGAYHDILIRCRGDEKNGSMEPELYVCIDQKKVVHISRLKWKFRGNQTIFVDGLPVDLLWDVHGWFFSPSPSTDAVFLFRIRTGLHSRLWLEEELLKKQDKADGEFSLLIYASRSP